MKITDFIKDNKEVWDVVLYGSVVRGKEKPNDIDIAIILNKEVDLESKLSISFRLREALKGAFKSVNIEAVSFSDLMDPSLLSRQAIVAEGYSLKARRFLHEMFGFETRTIFMYSLEGFTASRKKMIYYALKGRRGEDGLIRRCNAEQIGNTIIRCPLGYSEIFREFFDYNSIKFREERAISYKF